MKKGGKRKKRGRKNHEVEIMTNLIFQWGTMKYFPPICTVPTWGKKYHFQHGGGGEEYDFLGEI